MTVTFIPGHIIAAILAGGILFVLFVIAVGLLAYFLPTIIASGKKNRGWIFVVNLFLGWTFLAWLVALIWAIVSPREQEKHKTRRRKQR